MKSYINRPRPQTENRKVFFRLGTKELIEGGKYSFQLSKQFSWTVEKHPLAHLISSPSFEK